MADRNQVEEEKKKVWATILYLANTYTGAKFEKPLNQDQIFIIDASTDLVFNYFGSLSFDDLKTAFEMSAAGKFNVNLETYYGKFSVKTLTAVLNAYSVFRNRVLAEFNKIKDVKSREVSQSEIDDLNQQTTSFVKERYNELVGEYKEKGDFDKNAIFAHWGKILVDSGIINISIEQKREIFSEAKLATIYNLKTELGTTTHPLERKRLFKMISDVENKIYNEDFENKVKAKYSYLIVVKSILSAE